MAGKAFPLFDRELQKLVGALTFLETPGRVGLAVMVTTDINGSFAGCIDRDTAEELNLLGWNGLKVKEPEPAPAPAPEPPEMPVASVTTARAYERTEL